MNHYKELCQMGLPHRAVAVYAYLRSRANAKGECWPAVSTIGRDLRLSESTVRRAIRDPAESRDSYYRAAVPDKRGKEQPAVSVKTYLKGKMGHPGGSMPWR